MKTAFCICNAIALCSMPFLVGAGTPSDSWIPAGQADLKRDAWRSESNVGYLSARLDMDGDGREDKAILVTSADGTQSAVRICLDVAAVDGEARCHIVGKGPNVQSIMGLDKRSPGCFRFTENERTGETDGRVCTKTDVLEYFRFGSAASIFRYNRKTGTIERYWVGD